MLDAAGLPTLADQATVLVVDDHDGFRARIGLLLERHGYRVLEAADGTSAIRRAADARPDVALVDVQLPDVDGFEVARRLRRAGTVRVILLTSTRPAGDYGDRVADSAADAFLDKAELSARAIAAALAGRP